jgi:hypothetical protein
MITDDSRIPLVRVYSLKLSMGLSQFYKEALITRPPSHEINNAPHVEDVIDITNHEEVMCSYYRFEVLYMLRTYRATNLKAINLLTCILLIIGVI